MDPASDDVVDPEVRKAASRLREHARQVAAARTRHEEAVRARDDALIEALPLIGRAWLRFEHLVGLGPDGTPWLSGAHMRKIARIRRRQHDDSPSKG